MTSTLLSAAPWYQSLTLRERAALWRSASMASDAFPMQTAVAERRAQRWQAQTPFTDATIFAERLALDDLDETTFQRLLGIPSEVFQAYTPEPLPWVAYVENAFAVPTPSDPIPVPETLAPQEISGFLHAVAPLMQQGRTRVRDGMCHLARDYPTLPFDPETVEALFCVNLSGRLLNMLSRVMVSELNIARLAGQLQGDTPEARFAHFSARLCDRDVALALLQQYPVLTRQVVHTIETWTTVTLEVLQHLCADWPALCRLFSPEADPGPLVAVKTGAGDLHRGGRSVSLLTFQNDLRLVYKPRSLAVERHFQDLLTWVNAQGAEPTFRTLQLLDQGDHGWVEYVAATPCPTTEAVERFYQRQGGYLALLYALEATDFHYENLIAAGEQPVLIDLESLFHPRAQGQDLSATLSPGEHALAYSVQRILLLPQRVFLGEDTEGVEISGLAMQPGQLLGKATAALDAVGTDTMHIVRTRKQLPDSQHRPTLQGAAVNVVEYTEAILHGFRTMYRLLEQHRETLLATDGPLAAFAGDEVRVLLRPTSTYGALLMESLHPYLLGNALDRDRHFDRLWGGLLNRPYVRPALQAERDDLERGDIPLFATRPDSTDIWTSTHTRLPGVLDTPGLELVRQRLHALSEADLARQLWIIRASMAALALDAAVPRVLELPRVAVAPPSLSSPLPESEASILRQRLLATAQQVGDHLHSLALRNDQSVAWLGHTITPGEHWVLAPTGLDLYAGLPGIALFLAYLGQITGAERHTALARLTVQSIQHDMARGTAGVKTIGVMHGWGGLIYALTHLATLWQEPALLAEAQACVEHLRPLIATDTLLDVSAGAAGGLVSLLSLYRCEPSPAVLAAATACGEHLLAQAQPMPQGHAWPAPFPTFGPLTGFSHGAAGIAWALGELAAVTQDTRFRTAALEGLHYERSLFAPEQRNWPDLRRLDTPQQANTGQPKFYMSWCHGAPGIALSRLRLLSSMGDAAMRTEIATALHTTLARGFGISHLFGESHGLCHGDLGNLETLLQAAQILQDPCWQGTVERLAGTILDSIDRQGWQCGMPLGVETPGLMNGLAGIGYQLLRLAAPDKIPAVLTLEAPSVTSQV